MLLWQNIFQGYTRQRLRRWWVQITQIKIQKKNLYWKGTHEVVRKAMRNNKKKRAVRYFGWFIFFDIIVFRLDAATAYTFMLAEELSLFLHCCCCCRCLPLVYLCYSFFCCFIHFTTTSLMQRQRQLQWQWQQQLHTHVLCPKLLCSTLRLLLQRARRWSLSFMTIANTR